MASCNIVVYTLKYSQRITLCAYGFTKYQRIPKWKLCVQKWYSIDKVAYILGHNERRRKAINMAQYISHNWVPLQYLRTLNMILWVYLLIADAKHAENRLDTSTWIMQLMPCQAKFISLISAIPFISCKVDKFSIADFFNDN